MERERQKLSKDVFDLDSIISAAGELKYVAGETGNPTGGDVPHGGPDTQRRHCRVPRSGDQAADRLAAVSGVHART
ncbi:hypothetical protein QFZ57_001509 [Arthrobacter sp. B1I2]|nr:hypothetical protein [Arthrobacter sp. B1I2]